MTFQLTACAEILWRDRPIDWRASRLKAGLWRRPVELAPAHDLTAPGRTGASFTIMSGYLQGRLADAAGADMLLASVRETAQAGKRLGVQRLNLHGTGAGRWRHSDLENRGCDRGDVAAGPRYPEPHLRHD